MPRLRSGIYAFSDGHADQATASRDACQEALSAAGYGRITTEILEAGPLYYAEDYHQQYLAKVPFGYCGHGGTGVAVRPASRPDAMRASQPVAYSG